MIDRLLPTTFLNLRTIPTSHWGNTSKPFFVTIGCSLTENTHIDYKDCWSDILGNKLGLEHVNLAFGGSCLEYQSEKIKHVWNVLPDAKFCVWMQTYPTRNRYKCKWLGDHLRRNQHAMTYDDPKTLQRQCELTDKHLDEKILITNCWGYEENYKNILKSKYKKNARYFINQNRWIDRARDNLHAGPKTHQKIAQQLYSHIKENFPEWTQ